MAESSWIDSLVARGIISPDAINRARPYLDFATNFATGGLQRALGLPNNAIGRALQNPDIQFAMGMVNPIVKGAGVRIGVPAKPKAAANANDPRQLFIDEYDTLVRKKAADLNRDDFRIIPGKRPDEE